MAALRGRIYTSLLREAPGRGPDARKLPPDIVADEAFDPTGAGTLQPASKAEAFRKFTADHEAEDPAAALAFLQAEGMVEVTDDEIRIPARFWPDAANVRA